MVDGEQPSRSAIAGADQAATDISSSTMASSPAGHAAVQDVLDGRVPLDVVGRTEVFRTVLACPEIVDGGAQNARLRTLDRPPGLRLRWSGGCVMVSANLERFAVERSSPTPESRACGAVLASRRGAQPAARIGWALMGSTISVVVGVSVRVGARARSDPTIPADAVGELS